MEMIISHARAYHALLEAHQEAKALELVLGLKSVDICKDCEAYLELEKEKHFAVRDAMAAVLEVRCPCTPNHVLNASEIAEIGCPNCKAKVVLEV